MPDNDTNEDTQDRNLTEPETETPIVDETESAEEAPDFVMPENEGEDAENNESDHVDLTASMQKRLRGEKRKQAALQAELDTMRAQIGQGADPYADPAAQSAPITQENIGAYMQAWEQQKVQHKQAADLLSPISRALNADPKLAELAETDDLFKIPGMMQSLEAMKDEGLKDAQIGKFLKNMLTENGATLEYIGRLPAHKMHGAMAKSVGKFMGKGHQPRVSSANAPMDEFRSSGRGVPSDPTNLTDEQLKVQSRSKLNM